MKRSVLAKQLELHEGRRAHPYRDTVGKLTIGVGRNLDDKGLSEEEIDVLLDNDITEAWQELTRSLSWFPSLDDVRQHVLLDMAVNLGVAGLLQFKKMLAACERRDFDGAAAEMLDSKWATQVGDRAKTLDRMMRTGA